MSHLQTATRPGRSDCLPAHVPLEDRLRRASLSCRRINLSLAVLRSRPASRMDARATQRIPHAAAARAQTLPNPLPAHLLDHALSLPAASFALYVVSALLVSGLAIACWRSRSCLSLRYSALLLATVLLAPHLTVYDLVILAPAFLLLSDWIGSQPENDTPNIKLLLYLTLVLPLLGPFARWTHVQLSVLVMAALLYGIWKLGGKSVPVANSV